MGRRVGDTKGRGRRLAAGGSALTLLAGAGLSALSDEPAGATPGTCTGAISNYFDGYAALPPSGSILGVSANILVRDGALCTPLETNDYYSGWSMMQSQSSAYMYAQSGFDATLGKSSGPRVFAQANNGHGVVNQRFTLTYLSAGSSYKFFTVYDGSSHRLKMYEESNLVLTSTFDPHAANEWVQPYQTVYSGEEGHTDSEMIGGVGAYAVFDYLQAEDSAGTWHTTDMNSWPSWVSADDNPGVWNQTAITNFCTIGPYCFGVWDSRH